MNKYFTLTRIVVAVVPLILSAPSWAYSTLELCQTAGYVVTTAPGGVCIGTPFYVTISNSPTEVSFRARISSSGSILSQDTPNGSNWITNVSLNGSSEVYNISFNSALFANSIECFATGDAADGGATTVVEQTETASGYAISFTGPTGASVEPNFNLFCRGS